MEKKLSNYLSKMLPPPKGKTFFKSNHVLGTLVVKFFI